MSVSIFLVRAVLEGAERAGATRAELGDRLGLDLQRLEQPEARLDFEQLEQTLSVAVAVTGDQGLGLHLAEHVSEGAFDLLAHLAAHAPTMRKAIEIAAQFAGLTLDGVLLGMRDEGDAFIASFAFPRSTPLSDRVLADLMVAGLVRLARSSFGPNVMPRLACFEHERPSYHREYARIFGPNCRFSQGVTAITFDREIVDRPQTNQNPALYEVLRAEAERRLDRMTGRVRLAARLRNYVLAMPRSRIPDISAAARDLGMSERSLRRRLVADGTSYRDVVRSALEDSAARLLRDPSRTIKDTAAALGFADAATFHRAFKRWTGLTPGEYRRIPRSD